MKFIHIADVEFGRMELSAQLPDDGCIINLTLPHCKRDATDVNDVYNMYDIVPKSKLETLYDNAAEILNDISNRKEEYVSKSYYFFVIVIGY